MNMQKVIAALEAAEDGSEYLDYAIQRQFGLMKPIPPYTRSVDAAMQLFPEGWSIHRLCRRHDCRGNFTGWLAELYRAAEAVIEHPADSQGATAPLALCLAALRVREAQVAPAAPREPMAATKESEASKRSAAPKTPSRKGEPRPQPAPDRTRTLETA
jgi:hypothetical protein